MQDNHVHHSPRPSDPALAAPPTGNGVVPPTVSSSPTEPATAPASESSWLRTEINTILHPSSHGYIQQLESVREIVETIVFVVVLVLLLKSFAAEAFVIPTGSMAETLWGYQKVVNCPKCGYQFPVNASHEVEGPAPRTPVLGCTCPNCRYKFDFTAERMAPTTNSGDRVIVAKSLFETGLMSPQRHDTVVFKYPVKPQENHVPTNFIKRLIGLSGETIGIWYGKLYKLDGVQPNPEDLEVDPVKRWERPFMHEDARAEELMKPDTPFRIIRKAPDKVLALRRIVYDNDRQAKDLTGQPRWAGRADGGAWQAQGATGFQHKAREGEQVAWLGYRHLLREHNRPQLITDFMGYNTASPHQRGAPEDRQNWVGDLVLECDVTIEKPGGELRLELSRGVDRFQARWNLETGQCKLVRITAGDEKELDEKPTRLKSSGRHRIRFANVDERLTLWIDGGMPFRDGVEYDPPKQRGPTENDLEPASVGVRGAGVRVDGLKLWRDTYYTTGGPAADAHTGDWSDPKQWDSLRRLQAKTLYVQPGHYLCLGDNSSESSDGRSWGLVPERLMLGRALAVYYPFWFPFWPLQTPVNRVGTIE